LKAVSISGKPVPCKGIVFDKDGTLLDIRAMLRALGNERYRHLSARVGPKDLEYWEKCIGFSVETGYLSPFGPLASATRRDEVAVAACALWLAGVPWYKAIGIAKEAYDEADRTLDVTKDARLLPGVTEALRALHGSGLRLFIVTSDGHERTEKMLSHLGILDLFHLVVAADDVKEPKPSPEAVLLCAKSMDASPRDLIVVGDTPQDALMGKRAGSLSVGVLTGVGTREDLIEHCDAVIEGVKDISPS